MIEMLKAARRCSTPFVSIATMDQFATVSEINKAINNNSPIVTYDCVSGLKPVNEEGQSALATIMGDAEPALFTDPVTVLEACVKLAPEKTVIILVGADRYMDDKKAQQAVINCRDAFKGTQRMVIMLAPTLLSLPMDLSDDTFKLEHEVPDSEGRKVIITNLYNDAELSAPDEVTLKEAIDATRGLSAYAAEQAVAISLTKKGLDIKGLWQRWRQAINATAGLTVDMSGATLDDIGGLDNFKEFSKQIMAGRNPPSAIIRVEEIEKAVAGAGAGGGPGDSSGTSQSILQYILTWMQEENATGLIALGPAGGGKSLSSVAMGSAGNIPTITFDIGAIKGSLVGESEKNARRALATIKALAGTRTFWIGTCNSLANLPPELRRRFQYGVWFFDLPDAKERDLIWKLWLKRYPDVKDVRPKDEGWTGAEIRTAVQTAYDFKCTPKDAARWIVPVCRMAADVVEGLRKQAHNKYNSANKAGTYQYTGISQVKVAPSGRAMNLN